MDPRDFDLHVESGGTDCSGRPRRRTAALPATALFGALICLAWPATAWTGPPDAMAGPPTLVLPEGTAGPRACLLPEGNVGPEAQLLPEVPPARAGSAISRMVAEVDQDSLRWLLERLTGEVPAPLSYGERTIRTRWASNIGAERAAEFLQALFTRYGFETTLHYFYSDWSLRGVKVRSDGTGLGVGLRGKIVRTEDGESWVRTKAGIDTLEAAYRSVDDFGASGWIAVGEAGTVVTSSDGGRSWVPRNSGLTSHLNGVDLGASGDGWAVGEVGRILRTTNGGAGWTGQTSGVAVSLRSVFRQGAVSGIAVGDAGTILRTGDGGGTWTPMPSGTNARLTSVWFVGATGWAVGSSGTILKSTNGGVTWTGTAVGTATLNGVSFCDPSTGWAVGATGTILHTTNGGAVWIAQTSPLPSATLYAVSGVSPGVAWAGGGDGCLIRTTDGGAVWEDRASTVRCGWANVIATRTGTVNPSEEILLTGHYDSASDTPETCAPGADDDGSGIAAVVETARIFAERRFEKTIKLICFSGEEFGCWGSHFYAERAAGTGEQIVGVFNVDCVGWDNEYLRLISNETSTWLGDLAQSMALTYTPDLPTEHILCPSCTWGDHSSFWAAGFDAIDVIEPFETPPPHFHSCRDTLGLLDLELVSNVTKIGLATVATLAGVDTVSVDVQQGETAAMPVVLRLDMAVPDPFRAFTRIGFAVPAGPVRLEVFQSTGRRVRTLFDGAGPARRGGIIWDGTDDAGRPVPAGVYLCRIEAGGVSAGRKIVRLQ